VGGGVETAGLFEERVRLRVDGKDLEMVFDDTEREGMKGWWRITGMGHVGVKFPGTPSG
jgi:hypothetical protein